MAEDYSQARIEMLRRRWEQTASPHVSLQLADLYRQSGELDLAVETLSKGLDGNPGSVSLRVALGRYQMESGRHEAAVETLRGVVEADPSHLVANKLLVKAYVHLGRRDEARDRLDLYVLVNDSDPEIEILERSVEAGEPLFASRKAEEARPDEPADEPAAERSWSVEEPAPAAGEASGASAEDVGSGTVRSLFVAWRDGDPFPLAATNGVDRADLAAEGIFFQWAGALPAAEPYAPSAAVEAPSATMTLGRLYVGQGHLEEAAEVFRAVLETDPERADAREALADVEARLGVAPAAMDVAPAADEETVSATDAAVADDAEAPTAGLVEPEAAERAEAPEDVVDSDESAAVEAGAASSALDEALDALPLASDLVAEAEDEAAAEAASLEVEGAREPARSTRAVAAAPGESPAGTAEDEPIVGDEAPGPEVERTRRKVEALRAYLERLGRGRARRGV